MTPALVQALVGKWICPICSTTQWQAMEGRFLLPLQQPNAVGLVGMNCSLVLCKGCGFSILVPDTVVDHFAGKALVSRTT